MTDDSIGTDAFSPQNKLGGELARASTPLGDVILLVDTDQTIGVTVDERDVMPALPPGMVLDRATRIDVELRTSGRPSRTRLKFQLEASPEHAGFPESGEWLESLLFEKNDVRLSLGTRDAEWMLQSDPRPSQLEVSYAATGILIDIDLQPNELVSIPLALAYSTLKSGDADEGASTWFGVDAALP